MKDFSEKVDTMKRSKRIEALDRRAVNKDGFIDEWPEMGFVAMHSPYDPEPSIKIEDGVITELDGKKREDFDFLDQFIADYAIRTDRAEASMAVSSLEIARKIVGIRHHTGEDGRSYQLPERGGDDDGYAENACQKGAGQPGTYHQSER